MTGAFIFAYLVLPVVVGGLGALAAYLHVRADKAELRARAAAERSKG